MFKPYWALGPKLVYDHEAAMRHAHLRVRYVSNFFPYITGVDKQYHSQCQKLLMFPNLETKISQFTCQNNRPLTLIVVF